MSFAIAFSRACVGINAPLINIEIHLSHGLPAFNLVGLAEASVRESKERVRSAIINSGFEFPLKRITVNLAPADIPKTGTRFDLAIALGILAASEQIPDAPLERFECLAELALDGRLRSVGQILPAALAALASTRDLLVAHKDAIEADLVTNLTIYEAPNLKTICEHFISGNTLPPIRPAAHEVNGNCDDDQQNPDLRDVHGQHKARRGLEIAAAGGHNLIMIGPPGTGKSMLASRLPGVLPRLSQSEAFESAKLWSVSRLGFDVKRWRQRPFRAPHHSSSTVAIIGGGSIPRPGEVSLAHRGILFLDELPHFDRRVLEVLREPLETQFVNLSRAAAANQFPADFQLVAAMNPCPCGYYGDKARSCVCRMDQIERYLQKISGPLIDRIELHVEVPRTQVSFHRQKNINSESSAEVSVRVVAARTLQLKRQGVLNQRLSSALLKKTSPLSAETESFLELAFERLALSSRAYFRILKVSRTIADLEQAAGIERRHIAEALGFRCLDRMLLDLRRTG